MAARIAAMADVPATAILTSTATAAPAFTQTVLVIAEPYTDTAGPVSVSFKLSAPLAINDAVILTLPEWALTGSAAPTTSGCGTTTFTTAVAASGQANAAITFTAATDELAASTLCTIITATATAIAPATEQLANLDTRTLVATLASATNVPATAILTSPSTTSTKFEGGVSMRIGIPFPGEYSHVYIAFKLTTVLAIDDKIVVTLPGWTLAGTAAPTTTGCGTTTWTLSTAASGSANAAATFKVATVALQADVQCTIITNSATTRVAAKPQPANLDTRTISVIMSAATDVPPRPITTSTATAGTMSLGTTNLTIAENTQNTASSVTFGFTANFEISSCDTLTAILPEFIFAATTATVTTENCGNTLFTAELVGSGTSNAAVVVTASRATVAQNAACTLTIAYGIATGSAQPANSPTLTLQFDGLGGSSTNAKAFTTSSAVIGTGPTPGPTPVPSPAPLPTPGPPTPMPTPTLPTPTPTSPTPTPLPTSATDVTLQQRVTVQNIATAQTYNDDSVLQGVYEDGYASATDLKDSNGALKSGVKIASIASSSRRSVFIDFTTIVPILLAAATTASTQSLDIATLTSAIQTAAAAANVTITAPVIASIAAAVVTTPVVPTPTASSGSSGSDNTAVIVACSVGGGVLALVVIIAVAYYLNNSSCATPSELDTTEKVEKDDRLVMGMDDNPYGDNAEAQSPWAVESNQAFGGNGIATRNFRPGRECV